jgi:TolA-binding protein
MQLAGAVVNPPSVITTNAPAHTNALEEALAAFQSLTNQFPQSPLLGKACLGLGWCYWLQVKLPESRAAFETAIQRLPFSADQATAYFKLADVQYRQNESAGALSNYTAVVEKYGGLAEVRTNLLERALYQIVLSGLAAGDIRAATNALARLLAEYPEDYHAGRALLLTTVQEVGKADPALAQQIVSQAVKSVTNSALVAEARLFIARTYEQDDHWSEAVRQYDEWLATYTNHPAIPRAEYARALAYARAGAATNALVGFTNFIARFPTNELAPLAERWVGDYYLQNSQPAKAELSYKAIFQNTNLSPCPFTYQAEMMAARASVARQDWKNAKSYVLEVANNTVNDTNLTDLHVQALLAIGSYYMAGSSTNDYKEALTVFDKVCTTYTNNARAVLAWGEKAKCLLQLAQNAKDIQEATNGFQQVIDSPLANVTARSIAKVGLAVALEQLAKNQSAADQAESLDLALNQCLDVVYEQDSVLKGEKPDEFWTKEAGLKAVALARKLKRWESVVRICERLRERFPPLRARFEKDILKAKQEQFAREKS